MGKYHFIVNRLAGSGRCEKLFAEVEKLLIERGISFDVAYTMHKYHAIDLTKQAIAAGAQCVVAVGGDGTVNEVASVLQGTGVLMGMLPFGTGNDFARATGTPDEPKAALDVLLGGKARKMDGGSANGNFFINVAGFGFDVDVLIQTERYKQRFKKGMLPYMLGILQALTHLKTMHLKLRYDGGEMEIDSLITSIGNGQYIGGGMCAVPTAVPDNGVFDVYVVEKVSVLRFLRLLPSFVKGKHVKFKEVHCFKTTELFVECEPANPLQLDGEVGHSTPVHFSLLPGVIDMIVPSGNE